MDERDPGRREHPKLSYGKRIGAFRVVKTLGHGGYGDVYFVVPISRTDHSAGYAMKVELLNASKRALKREKEYMDAAQGCRYFPSLVAFGTYHRYRYMVIEMMGPSLSTLRRRCPGGLFPLSTVLRVGQVTLRIIAEFHARGMIHRDIKASNFLLKPWDDDFLGLIDFGLSKFYIDRDTGEMLPPLEHAGFKGTLKYASPYALAGDDQGRRDDLCSWFYMLVELLHGELPWGDMQGRSQVLKMKRRYARSGELDRLPTQIAEIYCYIEKLGILDAPDYEMLDSRLSAGFEEEGVDPEEPLAWEGIDDVTAMEFSVFSLKRTESRVPQMFEIADLVDEQTIQEAEKKREIKLKEKEDLKHRHEMAIASRKNRIASQTCVLL